MIRDAERGLRVDDPDYGQELREGLAPGVAPEHVDGLEEAEGILPIAKLARSLFPTSNAATALKLVVLFQLARADGRFNRERIRSLNRSIATDRLDAIVTSLHDGGWLELRDLDRTYRVSPLGHYFLSVLRAAGFAGKGSANLLIRAAETVRFGSAVDAGSETRLLGLLLAQTEAVADRARETLRLGRPRDLIRFSREEVRSQLEHVDQVLRALEERFQQSPALFDRIVRIHEAMQVILRAHKGLQDRLAEWNLKTLETAGAGYSLTALCDAVMGASDAEVQEARQQVRGLFEDFADDDSHLREKLGELFASLYVLRTADVTAAGFEVQAVPGGVKTFDLAVRTSTGATFAVEILNVFLDDERMTDPQGLHAFLDGRVQRKVREILGVTLPATDLPFPLLLVLWFKRVETMVRFADAVVSRNRQFELPPCALMQLADPDGRKCWDFGSIASLIRRYPT